MGKDIHRHDDILKLDLEDIDRAIGWLDAKYKIIAAAEGGAAGAAGLPGIPAAVIALVTLNLRAIGEYTTYCGFHIASQQERLFAMNVLAFASSPTDVSKHAALAQLIKIAKQVAVKQLWTKLEESIFVQIVKTIAESLGIRLTKAKLAQMLPALGGGIGAGFNAYYTSRVCTAAFFLYRERFLAEKDGDDVIERTVNPAQDFWPSSENG